MMDVVATDHIPRARAANVDPVAIPQDLHDVMNLVVFNKIVTRMQIGTNVFEFRVLRHVFDFMPANGSARFALFSLDEESTNDPGNDHPRIVRVMDQIVRHTVVPALAKENPG